MRLLWLLYALMVVAILANVAVAHLWPGQSFWWASRLWASRQIGEGWQLLLAVLGIGALLLGTKRR
jgi:hypothetical protein